MSSLKNLLVLCLVILWTASACTPAKTPEPLTVSEAASTLVAITMQAATKAASLSTPTALPSATPTFAKPMLYINDNAKCRTGITANFKVVASFNLGATLEMAGKEPSQSAWLVKVPNSADTCWIMAGDGSPSGDYESLPAVTPQPSTQTLPGMPAFMGWPWFCTYSNGVMYKATVDISWIDPTHDANGFRVYRQNMQVADLSSGTTSFVDTFDVVLGSNVTYSIEAYNDAGTSQRRSMTINSICK